MKAVKVCLAADVISSLSKLHGDSNLETTTSMPEGPTSMSLLNIDYGSSVSVSHKDQLYGGRVDDSLITVDDDDGGSRKGNESSRLMPPSDDGKSNLHIDGGGENSDASEEEDD